MRFSRFVVATMFVVAVIRSCQVSAQCVVNSTTGYSVSMSVHPEAIVTGATTLNARVDAPGTYTLTATCVESGCSRSDTVQVFPGDVPGDTDGSDTVDFDDLNAVLLAWGQPVTPGTGPDLTGDGQVDFDDLNVVLLNWGAGCP